MANKKRKKIYKLDSCGGKKKGGCSWGGATKLETLHKFYAIAA